MARTPDAPHLLSEITPEFNFVIRAYKDGKLIDARRSHNVFNETGRAWVAQLLGASDYSNMAAPVPHVVTRAAYIGFGCGGILQTDTRFVRTQNELVTVEALEDPVTISLTGTEGTYMKAVRAQQLTGTFFPTSMRTRLIVDILETEITFAGSKTFTSNEVVDLEVPISEAALYLSDAVPTYDPVGPTGVSPITANSCIAYNTFSPLILTSNISFQAEWELRLG